MDSRYSPAKLSFLFSPGGFRAAVAPGKFLDAPRSIDELLFAGEKGMTSGTDTDLNVATRRASVIYRAARAHNISLIILWMNAGFHLRKRRRNVSAQAVSCKR
jgi:hypothetical protein